MEANEVPEKIYLQEPTKVRTEKKYDNDVEYTRTDAFIERAVQFIKDYFQFEGQPWYKNGEPTVKDKAIERFINYMKEE